ncbi:MAG TPA: maleylpyruvate isomerase family mycothiol-dependent enzyme [Mycobacteriales bacterium]|nr:maleylpyruvate isomerase family mycothiol-dependent enzyme [Mycobacteriales bacterium]
MTTTAPARDAAPRRPSLDRRVAMRLAAEEYSRVTDQLRVLPAEAWTAPTDCPGWDVRAMASHVLGMADMAGSLREQRRQVRAAHRRGGDFLDALTGLQVDEHRSLRPAEIVEQLAVAGPKAVRGRRRTPGFIRRLTMPERQLVGGVTEAWTIGFLVDVILTRDPWMHRIDIARAVGVEPVLTPEHDGVLVADVAAEWAERLGRPVRLELAGPAGGAWSWGAGGETVQMDAVEFCRSLSGRGADGVLGVAVPF